MNKTLQKGKTLLVDGPASINITSGTAEVFGAVLKEGKNVLVRSGKRLPFEAKTNLTVNIMLGEGASIDEAEGSTIPDTWNNIPEEILTLETPAPIIMILGGVDSGKTSLCTYLCNKLLNADKQVAIVDGDLGQSDIGPPSTIGYTVIKRPIIDIFNAKAENCYFIGFTTPSKARNKVIQRLTEIKNEISKSSVNYIIVNTDGWIDGEEAIEYKVRLIEELNADLVIGIEQNETLTPILEKVKPRKAMVCKPSKFIKKRDRAQRKLLRELSYKKYLKNAKVRSLPLSWVTIKGAPLTFTNSYRNIQQIKELQRALDVKVFHFEESRDKISIVIGRNKWIDEERLLKFEEKTRKKLEILREGFEEGLLVALEDSQNNFLGIGVIRGVNYKRKTIRVYTPVTSEISTVHVGQVRLDKELKEVISPPFLTNYEVQKTV
jgi:polynucleotide 5'-hydroxyl-kinase GRC3/NOL9